MSRIKRPSWALVVAVLAVSMVLGGTGYAASRRAAKTTTSAAVIVPVWRALTPINGWVYGGFGTNHIAVYKDANAVVHLRGSLRGGSTGTVAFALPRADRPKHTLYFPIYTNSTTFGAVQVDPNGQCFLFDAGAGSATLFSSLDGVSFPVP